MQGVKEEKVKRYSYFLCDITKTKSSIDFYPFSRELSKRNFTLFLDPPKHGHSEHFEHLRKSMSPTV